MSRACFSPFRSSKAFVATVVLRRTNSKVECKYERQKRDALMPQEADRLAYLVRW